MAGEKDKMISGKPYQAFDEVLVAERQHAKEMVFEFNALRPGRDEYSLNITNTASAAWLPA